MAQLITVRLNKGAEPSWGFRLQGGKDFGTPLVVQKVNVGSPAERAGLVAGDSVIKINTTDVFNLRHKDAQDVIVRAGPSFEMTVQRGGSAWKPTVTPTGTLSRPQPAANSVAPVTKTSLAASAQDNIGAIGTGHNVSAKPFAPQVNGAVNGGPKFVNKQYNSPVGLYSEQTIAETLSAQAEVLSPGVLGVNFKKNEKNFDASTSAVLRMVQEAEKEPKEPEAEPDTAASSGVVSAPLGVGGLRHVTAPEAKQIPSTPQLPPGQNICADCERLIVGVFVRIKDKNLHVECFKCATCGTSLKNVGYYNINNKLYCDIHAKLAARSNPPTPNLIPVTVPPSGKAPASAISSALSGHPLPSPGPLSPSAGNVSAAPYQHNQHELIKTIDEDDVIKLIKTVTLNTNTHNDASFTNNDNRINGAHVNGRSNSKFLFNNITPLPYSKYVKRVSSNLSGPKPFSSVSGPLSPSLSSPKAGPLSPKIVAPALSSPKAGPLSPKISAPAPSFNGPSYQANSAGRLSSVKPSPGALFKGRSVQNIVWPPTQDEEPELPTASPLYFPPLSHLHVHPKECTENKLEIDDCQPWNEDEVNRTMEQQPKMSICSAEVTCITGRKSAVECIETLTETLDTQLLVASVLQKRPRSPPPLDKDISVEATIRIPESDIKSSKKLTQTTVELRKKDTGEFKRSTDFTPNTVEHGKKSPSPKIVNAVPKQWESPLLTALKTVPDNFSDTDSFSNIPTKRPSSALASALTVAPAAPFTPTQAFSAEPVPLPEYTEPYLPPDRPVISLKNEEISEPFKEQPPPPYSPFVKALQIAPERSYSPVPEKPVKRKKQKEDPILKDLPKPERQLTMREALETAPETPCAPLISEISVTFDNAKALGVEHQEIRIQQETKELKKPLKPTTLPASFQIPLTTPPKPFTSSFPPISDQLKLEIAAEKQLTEPEHNLTNFDNQAEVEETDAQSVKCTKEEQQTMQQTFIQETIEKQKEGIIYKKPLPLASCLHPADALPQYQVNLSENVEMELLMLEKQEMYKKANETTTSSETVIEQQQHLNKPTITVQTEDVGSQQQPSRKPIIMIQPEDNKQLSHKVSFQPVVEDRPPSVSFSPRPRPLTPSMINKPAPSIPYYQINLVAHHHPALETNLFDPMSPSISRSPSPCPEIRSTSPFRPPSATRVKSPAPGPPPNPLKSNDPLPTPTGLKVEQAKRNLTAYIPQHKEKMGFIERQTNIESDKHLQTLQQKIDNSQQVQDFQSRTNNFQASGNANVAPACLICPGQRECYREDIVQKTKNGEERLSKAFISSAASAQQEYITANATAKVTQQQNLSHLEQSSRSESTSTQQLDEGRIQIERKKVVTEEFEHTQKSKVVQIEKNTNVKNSFRNVNVSAIEENQGIMGLHVTNPQPITSPFISAEKSLLASNQQSATPLKPQVQPQLKPQIQAQSISQTKPQTKPAALANQKPVPTHPVPKATTSSSHDINKPNIPVPHTGVGGGRQAGAIGVAPKRGRGVLNAAVLGSRIPLCGQCHSYVRGPFITALGKIWCPEHFICATPQCRRQLQDLGFVEEQGQLYCEYCFEQYLAPPCSKCGAKVKGDCLKAIGKNFHPECFACSYCGKLFSNSAFFLEDGQPYCENDWNELFTTKCFACGFPVEAGDRWVEALNNNYHSQCFNCTMCKKNLEGQSFVAKGGRPFCKNHAR